HKGTKHNQCTLPGQIPTNRKAQGTHNKRSLSKRIYQDQSVEKALHHLKQLLALKPATRPWHLPFVAALCAGGPVLTGAVVGRVDLGITACLGALVILYIRPALPIPQRMIMLAVCSFGFSVCFALGLSTSFNLFLAA